VRKAFVWFSGFRALATSPTDIEHDLVVIPGIIKRRDIDLSPPVGEWPLFAHSGRLRREADIIEFVEGSRDPGTRSASSLCPRQMASFGRYSDDDAKKMFPEGWRSPKPYIRIVKQPV
jgi:hypothetical protein